MGGFVEIKDVGFEHIPQTKFDGGVASLLPNADSVLQGVPPNWKIYASQRLLRLVQTLRAANQIQDDCRVRWGLGGDLSTVICEHPFRKMTHKLQILEETYPGAGICALAIARRGDESKFVQLLQLRMYFLDMSEQAAKQRLV